MYESRQYPLKASISKLSHISAPTVEELNEKNGTRIYELGSLFTEYILTRWKKEILKELILANGDLEKVLGITEHAFETGWFEWVRTTYQLE
jgi:hypothetical protein